MSAVDGAFSDQEVVSFGSASVRLDRVLAQGGFAAVYAATCSRGKPYVVKKIVVQAPEVIKQTELEVQIHSTLQHTNIVRLHDHVRRRVDRDTECFYLLLEACPKGDLMKRIESAASYISTAAVVKTFRAVAAAVAYLHSATTPSAAHRDLKFENILIAQDGTLKLCDFGSLSQYHGVVGKADRVQVEDSITRFCTPQYRAPELVDLYGGHTVDHRSDIWALGCILYGLMFRTHPWDVTSSLAILSGKYTVPEGHPYPPALLHAVDCCLALSPDNRPCARSLEEYFAAMERGAPPGVLDTEAGTPSLPQAQEAAQREEQEAAAAAARRHAAAANDKQHTLTAPVKTSAGSSALQARLAARGGSAAPAARRGGGASEYDPFTAPTPADSVELHQSAAASAPDGDDPFGTSGGGVDDPFASPAEAAAPAAMQDWTQDMDAFGQQSVQQAVQDDPFATEPPSAPAQGGGREDPFAAAAGGGGVISDPFSCGDDGGDDFFSQAAPSAMPVAPTAGGASLAHEEQSTAAPSSASVESLAQRVQRMQAAAATAQQGNQLYHSSPGNPFAMGGGGVPPGAAHRHSISAGQRISSMMPQPAAQRPGGYGQYAPGTAHPMQGRPGAGWM